MILSILDNFDEFENSTSWSSPQYMNNFDEGLYLEAQKQILRCYHVGMKNWSTPSPSNFKLSIDKSHAFGLFKN